MEIRTLVLCSALLLTPPLVAGENTDTIVMKNGDRITCEIKGLKAGVLYVSIDYMLGTSSVEWSKVARLQSPQLFIVKTESGFAYTGVLSTTQIGGDRPMEIQVVETPESKVALGSSQVVTMDKTFATFWQRFNGAINSGITYSKGNQSTQYSLSSQLEYPRARWAAGGSFNSNLSASSGANASTRNQITVDALRLMRWNNYFYSGVGTFLQSSEQGIDLQSNVGGGIGRYLKNTDRMTISVLGGLAFQNTSYQQSVVAQNSQKVATALIATNMKFFRFNKTSLDVTATLLPALSQPGRIYFNSNASYYVKLFHNLSWNVSFYGSWDNQPPAGFSGSDYGTTSGLSWTFGNR